MKTEEHIALVVRQSVTRFGALLHGADVNARMTDGTTPLMLVAPDGHFYMADKVLQADNQMARRLPRVRPSGARNLGSLRSVGPTRRMQFG